VPLPEPVPGLVIRYGYIRAHEHQRDQEEGMDRPCAIVLMTTDEQGAQLVMVVPVTILRHSLWGRRHLTPVGTDDPMAAGPAAPPI
jgi:hypothetical protein